MHIFEENYTIWGFSWRWTIGNYVNMTKGFFNLISGGRRHNVSFKINLNVYTPYCCTFFRLDEQFFTSPHT